MNQEYGIGSEEDLVSQTCRGDEDKDIPVRPFVKGNFDTGTLIRKLPLTVF